MNTPSRTKTPSKKLVSTKRNKKKNNEDVSPESSLKTTKRKEKQHQSKASNNVVVLAPVEGADKKERYKAALQGATQWQLSLADGNGVTTLGICRQHSKGGEITFAGIIETLHHQIGTDVDDLQEDTDNKSSFGKWALQLIVDLN